jgi:hypothetical protein
MVPGEQREITQVLSCLTLSEHIIRQSQGLLSGMNPDRVYADMAMAYQNIFWCIDDVSGDPSAFPGLDAQDSLKPGLTLALRHSLTSLTIP